MPVNFRHLRSLICRSAATRFPTSARMLSRFEAVQRRVVELKMPQSFSEMSFNLKMHSRAVSESANKRA